VLILDKPVSEKLAMVYTNPDDDVFVWGESNHLSTICRWTRYKTREEFLVFYVPLPFPLDLPGDEEDRRPRGEWWFHITKEEACLLQLGAKYKVSEELKYNG